MGHRHLFGTPQNFENDHDQSRNMSVAQAYGHTGPAWGTASEDGSFFYPVQNACPEGVQLAPHWNLAPRSNGFIPSGPNDQVQPCQQETPCLSQDPFLPQPNVGTFNSGPENYFPLASSSNYDRQAPYAVEGGGFPDITMDSGRSHQKRKIPGIPPVCEKGNTSRYHCGGTSSDIPAFSDYRQDMSSVDAQHMPWDHPASNNPLYLGNSISARAEGSLRNVRRRSGIDLETNSSRSHLPDTPPLCPFSTSHHIEPSSLVDMPGPSSNALTTEWSHANVPPARGRILLPDPRGFTNESNHFSGGSNACHTPSDARRYDFMTNRNPVPQLYHGSPHQSLRGPRNSYLHRSTPPFRPPNSTRVGNVILPDEGLRPVADSYPRHSRPLSATGWHNNDRNRRSRISNERYRSFQDEAGMHDRMGYEGSMIVDRPALYTSRNMIDQHRDLRLDIDNMSYEELLELGERIGTVNTGLAEDSILRCLKEIAHCSAVQMQEEERCAICLEAYGEGDKVGALKACSHHYHVNCIKKWLLMKNSCPICKVTALADDKKERSEQN